MPHHDILPAESLLADQTEVDRSKGDVRLEVPREVITSLVGFRAQVALELFDVVDRCLHAIYTIDPEPGMSSREVEYTAIALVVVLDGTERLDPREDCCPRIIPSSFH